MRLRCCGGCKGGLWYAGRIIFTNRRFLGKTDHEGENIVMNTYKAPTMVENRENIEANVKEFIKYLKKPSGFLFPKVKNRNAISLSASGWNLVVKKYDDKYAFVPSTFAALKDATNKEYHNEFGGGKTTKCIIALLKDPKTSNELYRHYKKQFPNTKKQLKAKSKQGLTFWFLSGNLTDAKSPAERDDINFDFSVMEGALHTKEMKTLSRSPAIAKETKRRDGYRCRACGYYCLAENDIYIADCHHLKPLASGGKAVTKLTDLITLCPNCHRIAHTAGMDKVLNLSEIKGVLKRNGHFLK